MTPKFVLERVCEATDEARALLGALDAELGEAYEPEQRHAITLERVFQPDVAFFVARLAGAAVGCGGVAFDDGFAELKRMYVRPAARGRGAAQALIARLEREASSRFYHRVTIETGDEQRAAIVVYERAGYRRCAAFGGYLALAPEKIVRSVFLEKRLVGGGEER